MKPIIKKLLISALVISSLILSFLTSCLAEAHPYNNPYIRASATGDLEYNFGSTIIFNDTNIDSFDSTFNVRNQTDLTEVFNATYSFTDELGETGTDISWIDATSWTSSEVVDYDDHDEVMELSTAGTGWMSTSNSFTSQPSGTIEYWIQIDHNSPTIPLRNILYDGATQAFFFYFKNDYNLVYNDGSDHNFATWAKDEWYHIRMDFECGAGSYLGLSADTYYISINGHRYGAYNFINAIDNLDKLYIDTNSALSGNNYIDAIGYSWDTYYSIGDNIIPLMEANNSLEADKWEFGYNEDGTKTTNNQQAIPHFNETGAHNDQIYINTNSDPSIDGKAVYIGNFNVDVLGLEREFYIPDCSLIQVQFRFYHDDYDIDEVSYEYFEIFSYDDTLLVSLRWDDSTIKDDYRLSQYDGATYNELLDVNDNINIVYILDIAIIDNVVSLIVNETDTFYFPTIADNKDGLSLVRIDTNLESPSANANGLLIDSISIHVDGVSQSNDYVEYRIGNIDWDLRNNSWFEINSTSSFGISFSQTSPFYSVDLRTVKNYTGYERYYIASAGIYNVSAGYLSFSTNIKPFIDYLHIYSVYMVDAYDSDSLISPSIVVSGANYNDTYVWVSNNALYYNIVANSTDYDYITLTFYLRNLNLYNKTFLYKTYKTGVLFGELRVSYTDATTSILTLRSGFFSAKVNLPTDKELSYIQLLITDNDAYSGNNTLSTGYFADFILRPYSIFEINVITVNLLDSLTPLLFFIVFPSFLIAYFLRAKKGDDALSKKVMIPLLFVFSVVSFAFGAIPIWALFLLILGFGGVILMTYEDDAL